MNNLIVPHNVYRVSLTGSGATQLTYHPNDTDITLTHLTLSDLSNLVCINDLGNVISLTDLIIESCPNINTLDILYTLPNLETLTLINCPKLLVIKDKFQREIRIDQRSSVARLSTEIVTPCIGGVNVSETLLTTIPGRTVYGDRFNNCRVTDCKIE